jgi:hypothetical protein
MNGSFATIDHAGNLAFGAKGFGKLGAHFGADGALDVNGIHGMEINGVFTSKNAH